MKKTFYQLHPLFLLLVGIMLGFTGICVSVIFAAFYYKIYWLLLVGIPASLFMGYWGIYSLGYHHIKIDEEGVFAPSDKQEKNAKIQYEVRVRFEDIEAVRIIRSIKNSKGKFIKSMATNSNALKTYLEFILKSGKEERIFIMYFSKKQRMKMLKIIAQKTGFELDYERMLTNTQLR